MAAKVLHKPIPTNNKNCPVRLVTRHRFLTQQILSHVTSILICSFQVSDTELVQVNSLLAQHSLFTTLKLVCDNFVDNKKSGCNSQVVKKQGFFVGNTITGVHVGFFVALKSPMELELRSVSFPGGRNLEKNPRSKDKN